MADVENPNEEPQQNEPQPEESQHEESEQRQEEPQQNDEIQPNIQKEVDNDGAEDGPDEEMFEGSTHNFALYYGEKDPKDRDLNGCIVAAFVIVIQLVLYIVSAQQVAGDVGGDDFLIPVMVQFGKSCGDGDSNLVCPPEVPNLGFVCLAAVLLAFFLMHDVMASVRALWTLNSCLSKFAAFVLLFESLFAAIIGTMFAVAATGGYDAIANCIGVLFIHDMDEKAFEAYGAVRISSKKCGCCGGFFRKKAALVFVLVIVMMFISLAIGGILRQLQVGNVKSIYGDEYWDNVFSSGYYDSNFADSDFSGIDWSAYDTGATR